MSSPAASRPALAAGLLALRRYWRPFVLAQLVAFALAAAYFASPAVRRACESLAALKLAGGVPFAMLASAVAGGVLPELFKAVATGKNPLTGRARGVAFNITFFAFNGAVVDSYYRLAAFLFGEEAKPATVAAKAALDQFAFTPTWLAVIVFLFLFERHGFRLGPTLMAARPAFYRRRVLPLLLPNWCFWIPMVSIIYALPSALQFLMFSLALAAWSLIMVFIARGDED